jgi:hypothetical protein
MDQAFRSLNLDWEKARTARLFAYRHPEAFAKLIEILVDASVSYLVRQFTAGVDGSRFSTPGRESFRLRSSRSWCIRPHARITSSHCNSKLFYRPLARRLPMIAAIFEVWPAQGRKNDYLGIAAALRQDLNRIDGFISVRAFPKPVRFGKLLSLLAR